MSISSKKRLSSANSYLRGCRITVELLMKQIITRKLDAEVAMHLLTCYSIEIESMIRKKDTEPPFLSRALAKALVNAGSIDDYETALKKITGQ